MLLTLLSETQGFPGAADTFWATCQQIQILTSSKVTLLYEQEKNICTIRSSSLQLLSPSKQEQYRHFQDIFFMEIVVQSSNFHVEQIFRGVSKVRTRIFLVYFRFISNLSYISMFIEIVWVFYFRNCQL